MTTERHQVSASEISTTRDFNVRRELLLGALSAAAASAMASVPAAGAANPNFIELDPRENVTSVTLRGLDGKDCRLGSLQGKPVLVSFWASWCPPCRRELPVFHTIQKMRPEPSFTLLPVSVDQNSEKARAFIQRLGLHGFRSYIDPPSGRVAIGPNSVGKGAFMLYGMPITYVVDTAGRASGYWIGEADLLSPDTQAFIARLG